MKEGMVIQKIIACSEAVRIKAVLTFAATPVATVVRIGAVPEFTTGSFSVLFENITKKLVLFNGLRFGATAIK